jgi:hypothetical protein
MGILDKVKQGAEQAKTMATQAAERAKEEAKELNLKRQINNEEQQLGATAVNLAERGEISHAEIGPSIERIKALRAELEEIQRRQSDEEAEGAEAAEPDEAPAGDSEVK